MDDLRDVLNFKFLYGPPRIVLAELAKGCPLAFQVLGYLGGDMVKDTDLKVMPDHARRLCHEIAKMHSIEEIRRIDSDKLNARCHQVKEQEMIHISANGNIGFALPVLIILSCQNNYFFNASPSWNALPTTGPTSL